MSVQLLSAGRLDTTPQSVRPAEKLPRSLPSGFDWSLFNRFSLCFTHGDAQSANQASGPILPRLWSREQLWLQEAIHKNYYRALMLSVKVFSQGSVCVLFQNKRFQALWMISWPTEFVLLSPCIFILFNTCSWSETFIFSSQRSWFTLWINSHQHLFL